VEAELLEEVLEPDECDDTDLGAVEKVGVDEDGSDFVADDEREEEDDGVDGAAGAFEV